VTQLGEFAMYLAAGGTAIAFLLVIAPIFKAIANRISGHRVTEESLQAMESRLAVLEDRGSVSGEVEAQFVRIAELEERLDFAERMLAERGEVGSLPRETPT
jgi:hypothetical protein